MSEDEKTPEWVEELGEAIASTIEFQGPAYIEWYYSKAEDNSWGVDLIEFYPALIEIEEAGPLDGEIVFVRVNSFDILAAQNAFDEVDEVMFGFEPGGQPNVTLEGKYKGQEVIVDVYFEPASYEEDETE
ncbi:MAG TPA: hypothetical protein VK909_13205 [Anaerolineales bacterium]|nr:hypothetical protein [Anaerolineales bacterium]